MNDLFSDDLHKESMPAFEDGELMSTYGNDMFDGCLGDGFIDMGELIPAPTMCTAPPSLMTEPLTLVPYGQHTLAIPTSMVTPQLLAHLASLSTTDTKKPQPQPTTTDATDASHATAAPPFNRLAQLGMELNALLTDAQRATLNKLHRTARDACDPVVAAQAKQQFWDVWYAAAPKARVDELRTLMSSCEEAPTPASATPASSIDVAPVNSSGVSTTARRHASDDEHDTAAGRKRKAGGDGEAALFEQMQGKIARLERALASVAPTLNLQ